MTMTDILYARKAPTALRRLAVLFSIICIAMWHSYFDDEVGTFPFFGPADWLTYLIGLMVVSFLPFLILAVYFYLPGMHRYRHAETVLLIISAVGSVAVIAYHSDSFYAGRALRFVMICTVAPVLALKFVLWIAQGFFPQNR